MPGVHMPHCAAPHSRKACCNGSSRPSRDSPSTVRTFASCIWQTGARHEFTTSPSTITEQAPHSPSPQPSFVPVKRRSSRNTSRSRFIGGASISRTTPLISKFIFIADRNYQSVGSDWNVSHECAGGVEDRRGDRGSGSVHRQFAYSLSAERSVRVFLLNYDRLHLRRVERCRDDVICQAVVHNATALPNQFLEQSVADRLQRPAFDLPGGQRRMDGAPDVLRGRDLERRHFVSIHVDFDLGDLGAVREDGISVAGVSVIVPLDAWWIGVTRKGA